LRFKLNISIGRRDVAAYGTIISQASGEQRVRAAMLSRKKTEKNGMALD
jgi:hypothetical protein